MYFYLTHIAYLKRKKNRKKNMVLRNSTQSAERNILKGILRKRCANNGFMLRSNSNRCKHKSFWDFLIFIVCFWVIWTIFFLKYSKKEEECLVHEKKRIYRSSVWIHRKCRQAYSVRMHIARLFCHSVSQVYQ